MKKNKQLKQITIIISIFAFICLVILNLFTVCLEKKIEEEYYVALSSLIGNVKVHYPDVSEEEWIQLINNDTDDEYGRQVLANYGIFADNAVILKHKKISQDMLILMNVIFLLLFCGMVTAICFYIRKRSENLEQLVRYVEKVEQGDYTLDLGDNTEDELSALKNELYKVTVLLKESADTAKKQKKALADSVSDISHQIKTPLTSVMVLLDNLTESEHMKPETRKRFLLEITRQLTNVNFLVASLLKLSRLDAGVVEFVSQPVDWDSLLTEVTDNLEVLAELKQIQIKRVGKSGIRMKGDKRWLSEAISNIVKNAIEHSTEGSEILLKTEENAVYLAVTVQDFGPGLELVEQKHIFERFYKSKYAGNESVGIGLSLAKEIVEKQGGYLTVVSNPGEGCAFTMKFIKSEIK